MAIIQIIFTVIGTGVLVAFINHWQDKKLKIHEIKLQKYFDLIEQLAKLAGNEKDHDDLRKYLNEALIFASDGVVKEILRFNEIFTEKRKIVSTGIVQLEAKDMAPLIIAVRGELNLKSKSITKEGLRFFQKP